MKKISWFLLFILIFSTLFVVYSHSEVALYGKIFLGFLPFSEFTSVGLLAIISAYFITVLLHMIVIRRISRKNVTAFYVLYTIFTVYTLFAPGRGASGLNLNPFELFFPGQNWLIVVLNFLLFVPIGFFLKLNGRNAVFVLLGILLIEGIQYFSAIGTADIVDVYSNFISYLIGCGLAYLGRRRGIVVE